MSLTQPRTSPQRKGTATAMRSQPWLRNLLTSWDFYLIVLIVLVAGFLRFYGINTTEFDDDQAMLFRLAYDAIHHGLLPVTSNRSSIGLANPPGTIYLLMLPAAMSSNPVWGTVLVGAFSVVAVVLTYIFTNRYFGRVAAVVAALLYAVTFKPLIYERFIWQPNLMAPFVVLFMFVLFLGVVESRKGWLFPALLLLGILYQTHAITLLLIVPLGVAIVLAPRTIRWRDLVFSAIGLLIIFSPFLLWEFMNKFADLLSLLPASGGHAVFDDKALLFYRSFLLPYDSPPTYPGSVQALVARWLSKLHLSTVMFYLVLGGAIMAAALMLWSWPSTRRQQGAAPTTEKNAQTQAEGTSGSGIAQLRAWWLAFYDSGYRRGLLLLLAWQVVPLLLLSRHSLDLHSQYFLFLLPGPFILIGLFIGKFSEWFRHFQRSLPLLQWARYAMYFVVAIIVIAQFVGSVGGVLDQVEGKYDDRSFQPYPYHNDLSSLQHALTEADQLAEQRHLARVYITTDAATQTALGFLTEQMRTPTTLFNAGRCLVLPGTNEGPAVLLVGPYDTLTNAMLGKFANATLIDQPARLGGAPFKLYIVNPPATAASGTVQAQFGTDLQLLSVQTTQLAINNSSWLVTRWNLLRSAPPTLRTTYNYVFSTLPAGSTAPIQTTCGLSSLQNGDQVLAAFLLPQGSSTPASVTVTARSFTTTPYNPTVGPLHLETYLSHSTPSTTLQTAPGKESVTMTLSFRK
jgi:4-amino-4-deoxy-L-arabinose transferase-like glycosyltransferase